MQSEFAKALAQKLKEKRLKPIDLEKDKVTSRQNLSRLLNDTPHPVSGALPKAREKTIEKIANYLEWDIDEARLAAGFAPKNSKTIAHEKLQSIDFAYPGIPAQRRDKVDYLIELLDNEVKKIEADKEKYGED